MEVMHLQICSNVIPLYMLVVKHSVLARMADSILNRAQLGIPWAARLHVRRMDGRVVAVQATSSIVGLVNSRCHLLGIHLGPAL